MKNLFNAIKRYFSHKWNFYSWEREVKKEANLQAKKLGIKRNTIEYRWLLEEAQWNNYFPSDDLFMNVPGDTKQVKKTETVYVSDYIECTSDDLPWRTE